MASDRASAVEVNRAFYDPLWSQSRLAAPESFNTWPLVRELLASRPEGEARLEVAPGLRPRLPLRGTTFVDASAPAIEKLRALDLDATCAELPKLPFAKGTFGLLASLDILEHLEDDDAAIAELARVAKPDARLLVSAPIDPAAWTPFDELVGHLRRYEPKELDAKLGSHGWRVEQSAIYGMQPKSRWLLDLGVAQLQKNRERAIWWYDRVMLPLAARFQPKLTLRDGWVDLRGVDEVLLVCRRV